MRLFSGKVGAIASDVVKVLVSAGDIETDAPREVERDVAAVLDGYVSTEREIHDRAKDQIESRGLSQNDMGRIRKVLADQKGIKTGDETLDYLLDQVVEMLLHSTNVEEVFAADHEMRRKMAPIFKKHMAVDDELANEVRGQMKHVQEGTTKWEIEYQRILGDIKRRKGLSLASPGRLPPSDAIEESMPAKPVAWVLTSLQALGDGNSRAWPRPHA